MMFDFLPPWPPVVGTVLLFSALLLAGLLAGELAARTRVLPRISGYIACGIALGPSGLGMMNAEWLSASRPFVDIALGLILYELGRRLDLAWLRHDRALLHSGLAECALSFLGVFFGLIALDVAPLLAALAAAVGMATSPAVVLMVAQELGAQGTVTRRAYTLVAINNVLSLLMLTVQLPYVHREIQSPWITALAHPLYLLAGSLLLAVAGHLACLAVARLLGKREAAHFVLQVGAILLVLGLAQAFALSGLLAVLALGILARNADPHYRLVPLEFGLAGQLFFIVLFVVTGAYLDLREPAAAWGAALAFVGARFLGKTLGLLALSLRGGLRLAQTAQLSLALQPMAGLAVGMTWPVAELYPEFGARLAAIVALTVTVLHLIGPIAVRLALQWAGEASPDAQR